LRFTSWKKLKMTYSNTAINLHRQPQNEAVMMVDDMQNLSTDDIRQTLHNLRVHQIELELQNEALQRAHEELDAAETRYFNLFNLAPVGYVTIDKDGIILEANITAGTLLGNTRNTLIKQPITRFLYKDDQDIYYMNHKHLLEVGTSRACELRMLKTDGKSFWVRLEKRAVEYGDGETVYHVVISDITDHRRMEAEKVSIEVQDRQRQKAESLGRMAGAIAHHFNNQLQVVIGNLEMVIKDLQSGENPTEKLFSAMQAAFKAAEVSSQMLTYLGQIPGQREPMDFSEACHRSLTLLQARAPKGTLIKADFPSRGPVIRGNAAQIHHVVSNLLTNAWESADEHRRGIRMIVKTVTQADILSLKCFPIDWRPRDMAYACLEVADAGCGISEKDIEKICDPFFSTKFTGRGLGLSVVLGIMRAHHGAVTVESEPKRGSIFRIFFPISPDEVPHQPVKSTQALETKQGCTVLVVDDEPMVRKMAAIMLTRLGFRVLEARDGVEAVTIFKQNQSEIRCVISDLTMPNMDGWETLDALRKLSPDIPVILSSGYDEAQVMAGEHPEPPNAFLGKPYQLKMLGDIINRVLET